LSDNFLLYDFRFLNVSPLLAFHCCQRSHCCTATTICYEVQTVVVKETLIAVDVQGVVTEVYGHVIAFPDKRDCEQNCITSNFLMCTLHLLKVKSSLCLTN
jgi:hypothetical protein